MKTALFFALFLGLLSILSAATTHHIQALPQDITLQSGRILKEVEVVRWERDRVVLKYFGGQVEPVPFSLITNVSQDDLLFLAAQGKAHQKAAPKVAAAQHHDEIPREAILAKVREKADRYFHDGRKNGSGYSLVFDLAIDLDEPEAVSGWTGRYSVNGTAHYNFYDSIWGGSFSSGYGRFSCEVKQLPSGGFEVTDFTSKG